MRIMLFGGCFDPPHIGHQTIARAVLEADLADAIWFVPCGSHPFQRNLSSAQHRLAMLALLCENGIEICEDEVRHPTPSYSLDTLRRLTATYPAHAFSWLMGSDQLPAFHRWHEYDTLVQEFPVYVYPREDFPFDPIYPGMHALRGMDEIAVSSTMVRRRLERAESIDDLVPPGVAAYIRQHHLYESRIALT